MNPEASVAIVLSLSLVVTGHLRPTAMSCNDMDDVLSHTKAAQS